MVDGGEVTAIVYEKVRGPAALALLGVTLMAVPPLTTSTVARSEGTMDSTSETTRLASDVPLTFMRGSNVSTSSLNSEKTISPGTVGVFSGPG